MPVENKRRVTSLAKDLQRLMADGALLQVTLRVLGLTTNFFKNKLP